MKGIYTVTKYSGTLIDGEWVKGDVIEVIDNLENIITPHFARQLRTNDTNNSGGHGSSQLIVGVSEAVFNGARDLESTSSLTAKATLQATAVYTAASGPTDAFWEIESVLNPPVSVTRQIRTVFLTSSYGGAADDTYSLVTLATPCPQTTTEILQINYKLILDRTTLAAEGNWSEYASGEFFRLSTVSTVIGAYTPVQLWLLPYNSSVWGTGMKFWTAGRPIGTGTNEIVSGGNVVNEGANRDESLGRQGFASAAFIGQFGTSNVSTSSTEWCGWPIKAVGFGHNGGWWSVTDINNGTDSSVQNTFGRAADTGITRKPFLDTTVIATSAAGVNILDKGDWVDNITDSYSMPYLYKIMIEAGGIVGTATYKIKRRKLVRWNDNDARWYPRGIPVGHMNAWWSNQTRPTSDGGSSVTYGQQIFNTTTSNSSTQDPVMNSPATGYTGYVVQRYVFPEFITFGYQGITINDTNHQHVNLDTNSTPALSVTDVMQVETDGSDIYVADAGTGLFKVERNVGDFTASNFTITQLSPPGITDATSCRGVAGKGGGRSGHPGKIVEVRIVRAGSNYAIADTVTFAGANGSAAAAEVNTVDGNGAITSIRITNKGSGYIEDDIQAYISSTTGGVGAKLDPMIGSGGDIWALFDDATDAVMYLAHTTRLTSDHTNLAFDSTGPETITRTGGASNFLAEGFLVGQELIIKNAEDAGNDGTFTITAVTATVITVAENLFTNATDTTAQIEGVNWEVMRETITTTETLTYVANGTGVGDTITGSGTSFITQGFVEGMKIVISSSTSNDGIYTIADVTATVITLITEDVLVAEGPLSDTMAALTDFTITNYTSGAPGRTSMIGLVMDPEHADDRFAMVTPLVKRTNDGLDAALGTTDGGMNWWSYANSTGTTVAGTTDDTRLASTTDSRATAIEQFGPNTIGPLSTGPDHWSTCGQSDLDTGYCTWGSATAVVSRTSGQMRQYMPTRTPTSFNVSIPCIGTASNQQWRTCDTVAQMNTASTSDTILCYDIGVEDQTDFSPGGMFRKGMGFGYLGKGLFWNVTTETDVSEMNGFYVWSGNGDGTEATEEALPYGFWEEYGWDGNDWVLGNASAKTTHAEVAFVGSNLAFSTTGTIIGTFTGTDWAGDGFLVGDLVTIAGAVDTVNNGIYRIESLSTTTLTTTPDKVPAFTNATNGSATAVGSHSIIDGLALSFDDSGGANPLVIGETYDTHLYDGILKDNATTVTLDTYWAWNADATGTDFSAAGSPTFTMPSANLGSVTNVPLACLYYEGITGTTMKAYVEPGIAGSAHTNNIYGTTFNHKIVQSTDFVLRFKAAGCFSGYELHMGLVPWTTITDGTRNIAISELDENIKIEYDAVSYPEIDQYTIRAKLTGNGADQLVYAADRVQVVVGQTETDYNGGAGEGQFIDGAGYANNDVITMDDGSTVTVVTQTGGQVTTFTVDTASLESSGRTERNVVGTYTTLDFQNTGSTITRTGGSGFIVDGFLVGMKLIVDASTNNDGVYTITDVADTIITVAEALVTNVSENPGYFGTGLYQASVAPGGGTGFALPMGTANETAVTSALGGKDEFSMHRIGTAAGNTTWRLNGVVFYTYAGALHTAADMGVCLHHDNGSWTNIYDASIDYDVDRRIMKVGNGTTTGAQDVNFRCLPSLLSGTGGLRLYHDGVEFVYVTDGYTAPAAGEVCILPYSGDLWFNSAQDGETISGNWTISKRDNLT